MHIRILDVMSGLEKPREKQQQVVVCVFPDTKEGKKSFEALSRAAGQLKYVVEKIPFEKLDFGETDSLDKFYSSCVAVADVTDRSFQAKIFYHLGLRESFEMKQNIVTYLDDAVKPCVGNFDSASTRIVFNVCDHLL